MYFCAPKQLDSQIILDTIIKIDTVRDTVPILSKEMLLRIDTVYLPSLIDDTTLTDSVSTVIPITQKEYETTQYKAWVSGYRPNLDSLHLFIPSAAIYVKQKTNRWGLGFQIGYSYPIGCYIGIGVSYNLWHWKRRKYVE